MLAKLKCEVKLHKMHVGTLGGEVIDDFCGVVSAGRDRI
jgi:hypothetical protein